MNAVRVRFFIAVEALRLLKNCNNSKPKKSGLTPQRQFFGDGISYRLFVDELYSNTSGWAVLKAIAWLIQGRNGF